MGDGLQCIRFSPKHIAKTIREDCTDIFAIAVGGFSVAALKNIVDGDLNKIVTIDGFFDLDEVIAGLVNDVCGYFPYISLKF